MTRRRRWFFRALTAVLLVAAASECLSLSLRARRAHQFLTFKLEAAFGRRVEVGHFAFSLFDGPRIEAEPVTVEEDPRFGEEYFLRAERMTAGLRWGRLLLGHFEFGTLSFTRPSLNLVRAADGRWNIESWLPPPAGSIPKKGGTRQESPARLYKIAVDGGRINFKLGVDTQPFALVGVRGNIEQETAGRWRLDLAAQPVRAGVVLQETGTVRVRGDVAGTTARLQPADFYVTWEDASLADVARLARGKDYGVRGRLALELRARSEQPGRGWKFSVSARGWQFHRWDMPELARDPALNLKAEAQWIPGEARIEIPLVLIEAPRSHVRGAGQVIWPLKVLPELRFDAAEVSLADSLDWLRAFRPGVADDVAADGMIHAGISVRDWPLRIEQAQISSAGATLRVPHLPDVVRLGKFSGGIRRDLLEIDAAVLQFVGNGNREEESSATIGEKKSTRAKSGKPLEANQLELSAKLSLKEKSAQVTLDGGASHAEELLTIATGLGRPSNPRWKVEGPAEVHLRWQMTFSPWTSVFSGSADLNGARLWTSGLNFPLEVSQAHMEWGNHGPRATFSGVKALGGQWQGTIALQGGAVGIAQNVWQFNLSADRVSAAEMDRWLGPRARLGFFARLFPPAASPGGTPQNETAGESVLKDVNASGQIAIGELEVERLRLRKLRANAVLESRTLRIYEAQAEAYTGKLSGALEAKLGPQPEYRVDANFERINIAALSDAAPKLRNHFGGIATGEVHLTTHGIGRDDLVKSLEGRGAVTFHNAMFRGMDLAAAMAQGTFRPGSGQWLSAEGTFTVRAGKIEVPRLQLDDREKPLQAEGTIQFTHAWDFRIRPLGDSKGKNTLAKDARTVRITGSLEAPQISPEATLTPR